MTHVFISYAHEDADYARLLAEELERLGIETWIDEKIPKGALWAKTVIDNLNASSALIVIMTPHANASEWVHKELLIAMDRNLTIVPLLRSGKQIQLLIDRQFEDVTNGKLPSMRFFDRLKELIGSEQPITNEGQPSKANLIEDSHKQEWISTAYVDALEAHFADIVMAMPTEFTAHQFILRLAQHYQADYIHALSAYIETDAPFRNLHGQLSKRLKAKAELVTALGKVPSHNIWNEPSESELYRKVPRPILETNYRGLTITDEQIRVALQNFAAQYPDTNTYEKWLDNPIYRHAVEYEGYLYPPKEILRRVTGLTNERIKGATDRNAVFTRLGFNIIPKPVRKRS